MGNQQSKASINQQQRLRSASSLGTQAIMQKILCPGSNKTLRKHAYSNILEIVQLKKDDFQIKKQSDIFHITTQNIDCGYSLEPRW